MHAIRPRPIALIILDGFGYREDPTANAIYAAQKPYWDKLWQNNPHTVLSGSGRCVGLPHGQMGNSEVGHLNMGAGRIVNQDFTRIDLAIEDGSFNNNPILLQALQKARQSNRPLHIMGLVSPGGVHSHELHIQALVKLAAQHGVKVLIHAFLDGRDTPPKSAYHSLEALENLAQSLQVGRIASLIGRYYAMDRDKRWERVQSAYDMLVAGLAPFHANTPLEGLTAAYERGETDEFVQATLIGTAEPFAAGDVVIFMNFRADRARQLTDALTNPDFQGFVRNPSPHLAELVCLANYDDRFPLPVVFPPAPLTHLLTDIVSAAGLKQLRIAETEKYAHVTFFFNGGIETALPGETRVLIPSPKVATYDLLPEMSAPELTERLTQEIASGTYDLIICNFANPDMVGHTGNFDATVKAIECIDTCLQKIDAALQKVGGELLITADHGNAEQMFNFETNQPHTAHTCDPVPFIYHGRAAEIIKPDGKLSDIAPTLLYLLGLPQPAEMTGRSLLKLISRE